MKQIIISHTFIQFVLHFPPPNFKSSVLRWQLAQNKYDLKLTYLSDFASFRIPKVWQILKHFIKHKYLMSEE